ncbi:MAG: hypothetical protein WC858_04870 [Parcubacteria group bacterium]|jgi:hypothetical protein
MLVFVAIARCKKQAFFGLCHIDFRGISMLQMTIRLLLVMFLSTTLASTTLAEEEISPKVLEKKFSLLGTLKFDLYIPKGKPAFTEHGFFLYAHREFGDYGIGAGADQWGGWDKFQSNHWTARPFMTVNWKQFYLIGGYSADSKHGDGHIFAGMWFVDKWWNSLDVFVDARYFIGVRNEISDFIDIFSSLKYAINNKYKIGMEAEYIGWFGQDKDHNWSMAGIVGERQFNGWSLGIRPAIAWDTTDKYGTVPNFWLRTFINF